MIPELFDPFFFFPPVSDRQDIMGQFSMVNLELFNIVEDIKKVSKAFVVHPKNVNAENAASMNSCLMIIPFLFCSYLSYDTELFYQLYWHAPNGGLTSTYSFIVYVMRNSLIKALDLQCLSFFGWVHELICFLSMPVLPVMLSSKLLPEMEIDDNAKREQLLLGMQNLPVSVQIEKLKVLFLLVSDQYLSLLCILHSIFSCFIFLD